MRLASDHLARLAAVSQPQLNFPAAFLETGAGNFGNGLITINGQTFSGSPFVLTNEVQRY